MNTKTILGNDYDKFSQLVKCYSTPSDDFISKADSNPYMAVELCDNVIDVINGIVQDIKSDMEQKIQLNVNRLIKLKENKIEIVSYRQRLLDQIADEEKQASDIIKEIESI